MSTFLLVHGAWHGGSCWQRVVALLERDGHTVHAPTLAGLAERAGELTPAIGLEDHVRDVLDALAGANEPVSLVGHSYAGLVVREAAPRAPEKVREVVLVEGWIGPAGASLLDLAPDWFSDGIRRAAAEQGDGWRIPVPDPAAVGVQDPDDVAWLRQRLTEHPLKTFTDPTTAAVHMPIAMRAILASPGPVPFADMAGQLGIPTQRIEGGHDLMITSPQALAGALVQRA
ncbi:MAG: alpha/beta fold hydrolase [Solirubrobacteraceae bacterium]